MAVAFANNWDIIISKLESLFRAEFKGALKVYSGLQNEMEGNQYLRLSPISSSLVDYSTNLETREFVIGMALYFNEPNIKKTGIDNVMRLVSRIETIIANNNSITLPDSSVAYDCKIESSEIEASDSEYLVEFNFRCTHANSISYPTVAITASEVVDGASSEDGTLSLTFKTSHVTTNFVVGDISVSNGSLSSFAGSGTTYTATFTPTSGGATTIQVTAGKFTDYSGNNNVASDVFNWTYVEKFISTWTLSVADTVTLPLVSGSDGVYNFDIDWGDGTTSTITAYDQVLSGESVAVTHTYTGGGVKTISIGGTNNTIKGWKFNNTGDKTLITTITNWGTLNISTNSAFYGCSALNVTASNTPTISSTDLTSTFNGCAALTSIGGDWDVSSVTNMSSMFYGTTNFNGDISAWVTSALTNTTYMFSLATSFNQNIGGWDMADVTTMSNMFNYATSFNNGGSDTIQNWNTATCSNMNATFRDCSAYNQPMNTDGNKWNTAGVLNMALMFDACTIFNQDISDWNTAAVTNMNGMFQEAEAYNQPMNTDGNKWNTAAVTNMYSMFLSATAFNQDIGDWNTSLVTDMGYMLYATAFNQDISSWDVDQVTSHFTNFLQNANAFSTANYNLLLHHWEADDPVNSLNFHGGDATTNTTSGSVDGTAARARLVDNHSWSITDGD